MKKWIVAFLLCVLICGILLACGLTVWDFELWVIYIPATFLSYIFSFHIFEKK